MNLAGVLAAVLPSMPVAIGAYSNTAATVHKIGLRAAFLGKGWRILRHELLVVRCCTAAAAHSPAPRLTKALQSGTCESLESLGKCYPMHEL
jgi:hypothetical protein